MRALGTRTPEAAPTHANDDEAHVPTPGTVKAQFTAALLLEEPVKLSFGQLQAELKRIAPQAVLGD
jgi:hypothetical protein